jgi:acyl-CoA thioesterase FadM
MGQIRRFKPEKLVMPILISREKTRAPLLEELRSRYGPVDYTSIDLPFTYTHYYDEEMGTPITRFIISFLRPVDPGTLAQIKVQTNQLESRFAEAGRRKVNIDPGLLNLGRFVLASTKEGSHRVPLSDGVFAEVTLVYRRGGYSPLEWTYPDYRSEEYLRILGNIRKLYKG